MFGWNLQKNNMSKPDKHIWVLYKVVDDNILASSAGLPNPEVERIDDYCKAIFVAENSLVDTNGIKMIGVWDNDNPSHTINYKAVQRIP
jgi:hypothetical protein